MPSRSIFIRSRGLPFALALISSLAACDEGPEWIASPGPSSDAAPEAPRAAVVEPVRYGRDVRPILADRCFICHGPDAAKRKAEMRLDQFESATTLRDGIAPIAPGNPERSELLRRVACTDPDDVMPPADSNKRAISSEERETLRRWIAEGAKYEPHWAFTPPLRPAVPVLADKARAKNPIDAFVLANLEKHGASPSAEASPPALLRRAFLDITGLPPTPEELDHFLADTRADRYERWIEKLFHQEPYATRYAERMATPWLDAARYADTSGIHMDAGRSIWPWRDWLLAAYRANMPFDRFVTEQIAGDLLPEASDAQRVASGFNRNHVTSDEGGAIAEEYLVEYAVDRAATTGSVFLGLTMGCARCHDHKFDPISQEDFYRFYAYFDSIEEPGLYSQVPDAKRALEPFMDVPSDKDRAAIASLEKELEAGRASLDEKDPTDSAQREQFLAELVRTSGLEWVASSTTGATSAEGATMNVESDGSVLASGKNPDTDEYAITLRTEGRDLRLIALEALTDASFANERVGRAYNGNAVMTGISAQAVSLADPGQKQTVHLRWAWADHEQANGDFRVVNTLDGDPATGWAVQGHEREGGRFAMFLADEPFGFAGGTELRIQLESRSMYAKHVLGRVRLSLGKIADAGLDALPVAATSWALIGPFPSSSKDSFDAAFGPESKGGLDFARKFGEKELRWSVRFDFADGALHNDLPAGATVSYVGRKLFVPSKRTCNVTLGSDDGFRLFVDGMEVAKNKIDRALAADADKAQFEVDAGLHDVVLKIVNTGGIGGFEWRALPGAKELAGDLMLAFAPRDCRVNPDGTRLERAWRLVFSPSFRAKSEALAKVEQALADARMQVPRTMVMKELAMQRETFVLMRGQYDKPDKQRKVERGVPAAFGGLPEGAPADRRGLAQWLVSPKNPLVARVAVNRMWEMLFGAGIVRTSEDFGLQGEWPSHPELLDWLAVEFVESDWDVQHMLRLMLESATYRQISAVRPQLSELDPQNRWLGYFPRQRLSAEAIRDEALYVSGLLVEKLGGPSVKPYQPEGLWQEVAMPQSNTRIFERGMGEDMWRRSLYTYWKRACPPPSMLTLDAPTREFCTIRRASTNTPLQALVLWNDEQFVEAARMLAERAVREPAAGDDERLVELMRRCTGRAPDALELEKLRTTLVAFRSRFVAAVDDAKSLIAVGTRMADASLDPAELAAWTMISSAILNLDATITKS